MCTRSVHVQGCVHAEHVWALGAGVCKCVRALGAHLCTRSVHVQACVWTGLLGTGSVSPPALVSSKEHSRVRANPQVSVSPLAELGGTRGGIGDGAWVRSSTRDPRTEASLKVSRETLL